LFEKETRRGIGTTDAHRWKKIILSFKFLILNYGYFQFEKRIENFIHLKLKIENSKLLSCVRVERVCG